MRRLLPILLVATSCLAGRPASASGPEETIRWIYTSLAAMGPAESRSWHYLAAPAQRGQYFSARMVALLDANDSYGDNLMTACLDFVPHIPGNDYNAREIEQTLDVRGGGDDTRRSVTAYFSHFGQPVEVVYDFVSEGGFWRIDDVAGPGYRLSRIDCKPRGVEDAARDAGREDAEALPAYTGGEVGYCYQSGYSTFRLDVDASGAARFDLESAQANGHMCTASGEARRIRDGWVHEADLPSGPCRIEILITAEQGLRLTDRDWTCKPSLCGQRAAIDGLVFTRDQQIACALMPPRNR